MSGLIIDPYRFAAAVLPSIAFVGITKAAATQNHTLNNVAIGAAAATRRVIFVVHSSNSVAFRSVSSFTVDGVSVTPAHVAVNSSGFNGGRIEIFSVLKPTGTTANLQINFSGANAALSVEIFSALNETSASPNATMTDDTQSSGVLNGTINVLGNGWVLAAANGFGASPSPTGMGWTGVTEVDDDVVGTSIIRASSGVQNSLPVEVGRAISATIQGSTASQLGALAAMSWG
jgi:hypothetical protein